MLFSMGAQYVYLLYLYAPGSNPTVLDILGILVTGLLFLFILWIGYNLFVKEEHRPADRLRWGVYSAWSVLLFFPTWWALRYFVPVGMMVWADESRLMKVVEQVKQVPLLYELSATGDPVFLEDYFPRTRKLDWRDALSLREAMRKNGVVFVQRKFDGTLELRSEEGRIYLYSSRSDSPETTTSRHLRGPWYLSPTSFLTEWR